jgi:hypothetical protein
VRTTWLRIVRPVSVLTGLLLNAGCPFQSKPVQYVEPPPPPDFWTVERGCQVVPLMGDNRQPLGITRVACGWPADITNVNMYRVALYKAAVLGIYLEREGFVAAVGRPTGTGAYWLHVIYVDPSRFVADRLENKDPSLVYLTAAEVIMPQYYGYFRERKLIEEENRVYAECRTFMFDLNAATAAPGRATACNNTMAVIDRSRAARQEAAQRQADRNLQNEIAERQATAQEAQIRLQEEQVRLHRIQVWQDAFRSRTTTTRCTPDYLGGVRCTTE